MAENRENENYGGKHTLKGDRSHEGSMILIERKLPENAKEIE